MIFHTLVVKRNQDGGAEEMMIQTCLKFKRPPTKINKVKCAKYVLYALTGGNHIENVLCIHF